MNNFSQFCVNVFFRSLDLFFFFNSPDQQLPVKIYESVIDIVQGEATMLFVNLSYTLATEEAERIGVDHVVRTSTHENGGKSAGKNQFFTFYSFYF